MKEEQLFDGLKVFSATKASEREVLGERITEWLRINPHVVIVDKKITQSSDQAFHCLAITLFYKGDFTLNKEVPNVGNQTQRQSQGRVRMETPSRGGVVPGRTG